MKYKCTREILNIWCELLVYLTTISMYYVLYKMGNSKSETESMKIKKLKMIVIQYRCKPACAPLFNCAHSILKLRAMVIHVRVYARRLTIHIHFTQAQPCRNYRYMPRSWPYTELRNGKKRGIDQSETSSHLTHLIYAYILPDVCGNSKLQNPRTIAFIM